MRIPVINCSLASDNRAFNMAQAAYRLLTKLDAAGRLIDLREVALPLVAVEAAESVPEVRTVKGSVERAPAVLLAASVTGFDLSAVAHNLIELTGDAFNDKIIGLLVYGSSRTALKACDSLLSTLILHHQCLIVPRYVYASKRDFSRAGVMGEPLEERIGELCSATVKIAKSIDLSQPIKVRQKVKQPLIG